MANCIKVWNARNQLAQITGPSGTASFKYDALGRRVGKTVNGQTVSFVYDGAQAIAEIIGSAITATYLTGLNLDEVLARYAGSGNKTLLTDALGSVIAQANDQQGIQNFYAYTPYGEVQPLGPDDNNPIQYTARENDQTGLYYYRARYYDPVLKRFISEDPIGIVGGLDLAAYVYGDPVSNADPTGKLAWVPAAAIIGGIIGGLGNIAQTLNDPCFNGSLLQVAQNGLIGAALGATAGVAFGLGVPGIVAGAVTGAVTGGLNAATTGGNVAVQAAIGAVAGGIGGAVGLVSARAAYWSQFPVIAASRQSALAGAVQAGNTTAAVFSNEANTIANLGVPSSLGGLGILGQGASRNGCTCK